MTLTAGHTTSGGEQVAAALPGATVVKAFDTVMAFKAFGTVMAGGTETGAFGGRRLLLPVAGDGRAAVKTVAQLGAEPGFDAVDAGPLGNARYREPAVELLTQPASGRSLGAGIGFAPTRA